MTHPSDIHPVVNYRNELRVQTAIICSIGTKWMNVVIVDDGGLHLKRILHSEVSYMKPLMYKGKPYPLKRAVRLYKGIGKRLGTSKGAMRELRACV